MENTEFLTVAEAAAHWRVGHTTVLDWIRRGRLRAYRLGGSYRIKPEDAEVFEVGSVTGGDGEMRRVPKIDRLGLLSALRVFVVAGAKYASFYAKYGE